MPTFVQKEGDDGKSYPQPINYIRISLAGANEGALLPQWCRCNHHFDLALPGSTPASRAVADALSVAAIRLRVEASDNGCTTKGGERSLLVSISTT